MSKAVEGKLRMPITEWIIRQSMYPVFEVQLSGYCDVLGVQFAGQVFRLIPPIIQTVAVELKIDDVAGVLRQAKSNAYYVNASYAAMPKSRTDRMKPSTHLSFLQYGVGLLSVGDDVRIVIPAILKIPDANERLRRKLWRRRHEWRQAHDCTELATLTV